MCNKWIQKLILYHNNAIGKGLFEDWIHEPAPISTVETASTKAQQIETAITYTNFNHFDIKLEHPIFSFLHTTLSLVSLPKIISGSLLPPVELACVPINEIENDSSVVDLTLESPIQVKGATWLIDLTQSPLPPVKDHHQSPSIIEIDSTSEASYSAGDCVIEWSSSDTELPDLDQLCQKTPLVESSCKPVVSTPKPSQKNQKSRKVVKVQIPSRSAPIPRPPPPPPRPNTASQPVHPGRQSIHLPPGAPIMGTTYKTLDAAKAAITAYEKGCGFKMHAGQSKCMSVQSGHVIKKLTMHCHGYGKPGQTHNMVVDPSDHCEGHSIKTDCMCHYNLNHVSYTDVFTLTLVDYSHNHGQNLAVGAKAPHPASAGE
ncbi:hypothetical protein M422DRAFT_275693 [Sphaerobolus stellatus SS14]|uniref:Uncharacterized protein n=1 Tax=Sphaerobolus stellatus (strain SS14) TaxID=990650 RepID=A0A0C9UDX6_SPHS4|nr:hypothetical protein M422DRAFT_275693 [Sphaerobolus stellatus SS14]